MEHEHGHIGRSRGQDGLGSLDPSFLQSFYIHIAGQVTLRLICCTIARRGPPSSYILTSYTPLTSHPQCCPAPLSDKYQLRLPSSECSLLELHLLGPKWPKVLQ